MYFGDFLYQERGVFLIVIVMDFSYLCTTWASKEKDASDLLFLIREREASLHIRSYGLGFIFA